MSNFLKSWITSDFSWFFITNLPHAAAAAAKSLQLCPTLCDPIDGSQPGSPIPGILQARVLEWVLEKVKKKNLDSNCMQVRKQQLELDIEQQTGSK